MLRDLFRQAVSGSRGGWGRLAAARLLALSAGCWAGLFMVLVCATCGQACDTPVYRYAMYRWRPAPYEVYFFHDQQPDEAAKRIQAKLEDWGASETQPANVVYIDVDLQKDPALASVAPDVKKAWNAKPDRKTPGYLVVTPLGVSIFDGMLAEKSLEQLVSSPLRQQLAKRLEAGDACVFILLSGLAKQGDGENGKWIDDAKTTADAETILNSVVKEVNSGKIQLYSSPAPAGEGKDESAKHHVSVLPLSRTDADEKWLVDTLMSLEDDLYDFNEPMVFAIYGRARALPPFIGKGINRDLLVDCVGFVTGACSCTVKEQNPGVDLLVRYDWETAAAAVAEKFGAEEGNESQLRSEDFFPDLIAPPNLTIQSQEPDQATGQQPTAVARPESAAEQIQDVPTADPEPNPDAAAVTDIAPAEEEAPQYDQLVPGKASHDTSSNTTEPAMAADGPDAASSQGETQLVGISSGRGMWVVFAGIGFGLLMLFAITFAVMRPS